MAKKKSTALALPAQAEKDVKAIAGIADRWATGLEDVAKDAFAWAKKHKFLVLLSIGAVAFYRYWLMEPEEDTREEEDY